MLLLLPLTIFCRRVRFIAHLKKNQNTLCPNIQLFRIAHRAENCTLECDMTLTNIETFNIYASQIPTTRVSLVHLFSFVFIRTQRRKSRLSESICRAVSCTWSCECDKTVCTQIIASLYILKHAIYERSELQFCNWKGMNRPIRRFDGFSLAVCGDWPWLRLRCIESICM